MTIRGWLVTKACLWVPILGLLLTGTVARCASQGGSSGEPLPQATLPTSSSGGSGPIVPSPGGDEASLVDGSGGGSSSANTPALPTFAGPLAGPFTDFPADPVIDAADGGANSAAPNASQLFGPASQGAASGGPCLVEPEVGSLYPNNWLRPRFAWLTANNDANLFELRVHADNQTNDLVVYTTQTQWTMPKAMWDALRADSQDIPMTVSIRSGKLTGTTLSEEALGSSGSIGIAPVGAPGSIVYWAIVSYMGSTGQGGTGVLDGFSVGDESVVTVLQGSQVKENPAPAGNRACIGCHSATPDGQGVGFQAEWLGPNGGYANSIATLGQDASPGGIPSFLTPEAGAEIATLAGAPAYSGAHWTQGDRIEILSNTGELTWVDLEATGSGLTGVIPRSLGGDAGDTQLATAPTWSHDGSTIVYTSIGSGGSIANGRAASGPMDLYSVPYHDKAGGNATPVQGASDPAACEYYPAFSPDDQYIAFVRLAGNGQTYDSSGDEMDIVPAGGGHAIRLDANDPPACTNATSPGVTNSWPRWSPSVQAVSALGNTTYYWIVFSSTRPNLTNSNNGPPQLYITPVVVDATGTVTTYHSLYLWNQSPTAENHLPAWDVFQIPAVPQGQPPPR
ncbi:MAG: hypothetical protein ABTD50_21255 [Polyangiaceae bacterium]